MIIKAAFCQSLIESELQEFKDIPFTLFGDCRPTDDELRLNPTNIYWHSEPEEYFGNHSWIEANIAKFNYVLTWNEALLQLYPNTRECLFGTSAFYNRLDSYTGPLPIKSNKSVTFIRGNKRFGVPGHALRWELWDRRDEIKSLIPEFYPTTTPEYGRNPAEDEQWFAQRKDIFERPLFHIAIENTSHPNYFTEKIIDCFLWRTIPLYYGCPNIGDYFDPEGVIQFDTVDQLIEICNTQVTDAGYTRRIGAVYHNEIECKKYLNLGRTIRETLRPLLK